MDTIHTISSAREYLQKEAGIGKALPTIPQRLFGVGAGIGTAGAATIIPAAMTGYFSPAGSVLAGILGGAGATTAARYRKARIIASRIKKRGVGKAESKYLDRIENAVKVNPDKVLNSERKLLLEGRIRQLSDKAKSVATTYGPAAAAVGAGAGALAMSVSGEES
jgi:hypothetical protein